ncbi:MAG: DUF4350 domain-containing protein [Synechocystis sp.]
MALPLSLPRPQRLRLIALAIAVVMVMGLFILIPRQPERFQGSTYGRSPGDYGAWLAWMATQNTPVQPWQKPSEQLSRLSQPATLLRVDPRAILSGSPQTLLGPLSSEDYDWVSQGNRIVYLGRWGNLSPAPFTQTVDSEFGPVTFQGRRRGTEARNPILSDDYGTIIWRESHGDGEIIWVIPPFLAANAFQDQMAKFQLLQALMESDRHQLWVDEYLHGYKDSETLAAEAVGTVWHYLRQTPLFPLFVQLLLLCGLAIGWGNRRFGRPHVPFSVPRNNQQTYVQALAQVLEKANCHDFVVQQLQSQSKPASAKNDN